MALLFFCIVSNPADGFRRIAIRLILISLITAAAVGVYLWYNFNARSRLLLIMPEQTQWFAHLQTRQARHHLESLPGMKKAPAFLDSLSRELSSSAAFKGLADAGEPGIALMSDALVFATPSGWFWGLSLSSEARFAEFLAKQYQAGRTGAVIDKSQYSYVRLAQREVFLAYKYKAMVLYVPRDTAASISEVEKGLAAVFSGEPSEFLQRKEVQALYQGEPDFVFYDAASTQHCFSVFFDQPKARVQSAAKNPVSPLRFFANAEKGFPSSKLDLRPERWLNEQNQISSGDYANLLLGWVWERLSLWNEQTGTSSE